MVVTTVRVTSPSSESAPTMVSVASRSRNGETSESAAVTTEVMKTPR